MFQLFNKVYEQGLGPRSREAKIILTRHVKTNKSCLPLHPMHMKRQQPQIHARPGIPGSMCWLGHTGMETFQHDQQTKHHQCYTWQGGSNRMEKQQHPTNVPEIQTNKRCTGWHYRDHTGPVLSYLCCSRRVWQDGWKYLSQVMTGV